MKGAYDVLVSMGVITYFIPYLYLFAAMIKLQSEAGWAGRDPRARWKQSGDVGGRVGLLTTLLTIGLSLIPQPDEPNKPLAVFKVVGGSGALVLIGVWFYWAGKRRALADCSLRAGRPDR